MSPPGIIEDVIVKILRVVPDLIRPVGSIIPKVFAMLLPVFAPLVAPFLAIVAPALQIIPTLIAIVLELVAPVLALFAPLGPGFAAVIDPLAPLVVTILRAIAPVRTLFRPSGSLTNTPPICRELARAIGNCAPKCGPGTNSGCRPQEITGAFRRKLRRLVARPSFRVPPGRLGSAGRLLRGASSFSTARTTGRWPIARGQLGRPAARRTSAGRRTLRAARWDTPAAGSRCARGA